MSTSGTPVIKVEGADLEAWKSATAPIIDQWVAARTAAGDDGAALVKAARELVAGQE